MLRPIHTLAAFALLAATGTAALAAAETFRGRGNEPFWSVEKTGEAIVFTPMDGAPVTVAPVPAPRKDGNAEIYEADAGGTPFALTIADAVCADTMSGMPFPNTVTVATGGDTFTGCGGEPVTLLLGDWMIAEIGGNAPAAGSMPTLAFAADGTLNGNGSCNRFFGGYTLSGEGLAVGEIGASMMACEEPLMAQEMLLLDILKGVGRFEIGADGALILHDDGGNRTIVARPVA
jgi:heat shock protein HslJ